MSSLTARLRTERTPPRRRPSATSRRAPLRRSPNGPPRWVWTLGIAVLIIVCAVAFTTTFLELFRLQREADRLVRMRTALQQETAALRAEIRALDTPEYIEKIAREQLGLVKPGEIVLLIVQPPPRFSPPPASPPEHVSWLEQALRAVERLFGR